MATLEADVRAIRLELQAIRVELAEIKGEIRGKLSNVQLVFMQAALILAIFAAAFGLLKFTSPH